MKHSEGAPSRGVFFIASLALRPHAAADQCIYVNDNLLIICYNLNVRPVPGGSGYRDNSQIIMRK